MKNLIYIFILSTLAFSKTEYWWADESIDSMTVKNAAIEDAETDWKNSKAVIYLHDSGIRDSRIDTTTGLYSHIFGSTVRNWIYYFPIYNQTIIRLVRENGIPKNSYSNWVDLIENPSNYFLGDKEIHDLYFNTTYSFVIGHDTISFTIGSSFEPVGDTVDVCIAYTKPVIDSVYLLANATLESTFKFSLGPETSNLAFLVYKCVLRNREAIACLDIINRKKLSEQDLVKRK